MSAPPGLLIPTLRGLVKAMVRITQRIGAALCFCLWAVSALGQPTPEDCAAPDFVPERLLTDLTVWIALNTMYDVSPIYPDPPQIVFCDVGEVVPYEEAEIIVDPVLRAAYDLRAQRIYLVRPWSLERDYDVSVLLHELIHAVQLGNRDWPCPGAPEFEAYWLQDKWLAQRNMDVGFDWSAIRRLSTCPGSE